MSRTASSKPLRIGITQRVEIVAGTGERRDCLDQAWADLLTANGMIPLALSNCVRDPVAYLEALDLDGLILSGGNDLSVLKQASNPAPERDRFEAAVLEYARAHQLPVLGVCRGMQMMIVDSGGELSAVEGHRATRHAIEASGADATRMPSRETVNSYHNFGFHPAGVPDLWKIAACASDGTVEAVSHCDFPQIAIMWHPERAPKDARDVELMLELFAGGRS